MKMISDDFFEKLSPVSTKIKKRTKIDEAWGIVVEIYGLEGSISVGLKEATFELFKKDKLLTTLKYERNKIYNDDNGDMKLERMYTDILRYIIKKFVKQKKEG